MADESAPTVEIIAPADAGAYAATVPKRSGLARRQRVFLAVVVGSVLFAAGGLVGSIWVKSPAQLAADQGQPNPSLLTAPVVSRVLSQTIVARGTVVAGASMQITPVAAQGASAMVVTATLKKAGDPVRAGDVLIQVSGRPVIALPGAIPMYRDLKPGDSGADIAQLQRVLAELGYDDADPAGYFGSATKAAVAAFYTHLGYDAPTTGGPGDRGDASALSAAANAVIQARRAVAADQLALTAALKSKSPDAAAVAAARQTLTDAKTDLKTAQQAQDDLVATTGVELPMAEAAFIRALPATVAAINGQVGSTVTAPLVTVDTGAPVVTATLTQGDGLLVKAGMAVAIDAEALGRSASGKVSYVGPYSAGTSQQSDTGGAGGAGAGAAGGSGGSSGAAGPDTAVGYPLTVTPGTALENAWLGQDVRLTITEASTPGPVLVVPAAAVSTNSSGDASVTVLAPDGARRRVAVDAGVDANGFVQVTPAAGASLKAGDLVVTGS